jgi:hypothetical protein
MRAIDDELPDLGEQNANEAPPWVSPEEREDREVDERLAKLAAVDCAQAFLPFSSELAQDIRFYRELCVRLGMSSFFNTKIQFSVRSGPDARGTKLDHAGRDALRSLMIDFRQLWGDGERAQFTKIRSQLRKNAAKRDGPSASQAVALLDDLGRRYKVEMDKAVMSFVAADNPFEHVKDVPASEVVGDWLYGGEFHLDPEKAARRQMWSADAFEWSLIKTLHAAAGCYWELDVLVQGILAEPALLTGVVQSVRPPNPWSLPNLLDEPE